MNDKDNNKKSQNNNVCDFLPTILKSGIREQISDKEEINTRILAITPSITDRTTVVKFFTEFKFPKKNEHNRNLYIVNTCDILSSTLEDEVTFYETEMNRLEDLRTKIETYKNLILSWQKERVKYAESERALPE